MNQFTVTGTLKVISREGKRTLNILNVEGGSIFLDGEIEASWSGKRCTVTGNLEFGKQVRFKAEVVKAF